MNFWLENIKIRNLVVPRFMSGPLDGITDSPFRKLVRLYSKDELLYTEMRHVRSICTPKGGDLALKFEQLERPLNFQVSASSDEFIEPAFERIIQAGVDCIDLNVGCPAHNVVSSVCGSALMAHPQELKKILTKIRRAAGDLPITITIRAGFLEKNAVDLAKRAQDCGVDALAIHPRLRNQMFMGQPDYALAAQVKQALSIPVLFSGNVVNFATAKRTYELTGVDGFLIGRGMWAKPWKLAEMKAHAQGLEYHVSSAEVLKIALLQLQYMVEHYGVRGLFCFRKHLPFYLRGHAGAGELRSKLVRLDDAEEVKKGLIQFLTQE
jgi:tRNA-dihydrouridine synthase B